MTKRKRALAIVLTCIMVLTLIPIQANAAKKIKLNKSKLSLFVGKTYTLKLLNNKSKIKWSSSKKNIATVSSKGKVKAKKKGSCNIVAKAGRKKYVCKVTVKIKQTTQKDTSGNSNDQNNNTGAQTVKYGSVSGNITYFYNNYRGNVPDTNAKVILVSTSGSGKNMPNLPNYASWGNPSIINQYNNYGVYAAVVDGVGQYTFNNVKVGDYKIIIISNRTTTGTAFDNKELYASTLSNFAAAFVNDTNASMLGQFVGYQKYKTEDIKVMENQNFSYGYDFGITYI